MKKIKRYFAAYLLVFAMILCAVPTVKAQEIQETTPSDSDIVMCVTTIKVITETAETGATASVASSSEFKKITAVKTNTYKNSAGNAMWSVTITATFKYNGVNAGCVTAQATAKSYNSNWKVSDERVTANGASANGYATGRHYSGSKLIETITKSVGVSCSKDGKIS